MKTIIAGSRDITEDQMLDMLELMRPHITEVVSGGARGPDKIGEKWAIANDIPLKKFPADWDKWGKSAGIRRNIEMLEYADYLLAFWDGRSKGTKHIIDNASKYDVCFGVILVLE